MNTDKRESWRCAAAALVAVATLAGAGPVAAAADDAQLYVEVSEVARAPIGWVEFCASNPSECATIPSAPRDVVLTAKAFMNLQNVNRYVNESIRPMTDLEHWGMIEKWSYPDDGYGDCEDYVLLKRRLLVQAGWPREALLITVVRDRRDEGHAVLTVKTDRGEFILDNQAEDVLPWFETGYRFVKRQSQKDPNVWVSLGDTRPVPITVARQRLDTTARYTRVATGMIAGIESLMKPLRFFRLGGAGQSRRYRHNIPL
jgi:predicted transglutaminase-like cysteine proteinase